jgi:hypothetical protein
MKLAIVGAMIALTLPALANAQSMRVRTDVYGVGTYDTHEIGHFYGNNNTVDWYNGVVTTTPGWDPSAVTVSLANSVATASGYSDLASGRLGAYAAGQVGGAGNGLGAHVDVSFEDGLHFSVPGATATTVTPIRLLASLHASSLSGGATFIAGFVGQGGVQDDFGGSLNNVVYRNLDQQNLLDFATWVDGDTRYYDMTFGLVGPAPIAILQMRLRASGADGGVTDMMHTAGVRLGLPDNVTFTSGSGVFLTALTSGVPEPSLWAMMIVGFGCAGALLRRSRGLRVA